MTPEDPKHGRVRGIGNAVSPDNIRTWSPPYYGYAEPPQFLPSHMEEYTISRGKRS
jgi:hypothetical protein